MYILVLVAFLVDGDPVNSGVSPIKFETQEECLEFGKALYHNSVNASKYKIEDNTITILYPDTSYLVGTCETDELI